MKGLLAGKIRRGHVFPPRDSRPNYPIFQGRPFQRTQQLLDQLERIAEDCGKTISQLSIGWVLSQAAVTAAPVGARRPDQIRETAQATPLSSDLLDRINAAVYAIAEV